MLQDFKELNAPGGSGTTAMATSAGPPAAGSERGVHEKADSREGDRVRRQTPPAEGTQSAGSPRMQNRAANHTPTKHLSSSQSSNRAQQSNLRKQNLEKIRRDLQPFKGRERLSDPGFHHVGKDTVDKKMLDELINNYGYSEVGTGAGSS